MSEQLDIVQSQSAAEQTQALPVPSTLKSLIEALLFAAAEPLSIRQMKALYEYSAPAGSGEERKLEADAIRAMLSDLNAEYKKDGRPYRIIGIAGGYQFATLKEYADWVGKLRREQSRKKLSQSGVETLAIIAYKQPITKAEVESIRGVNCDYVLKTLLEKELVRVTGRAETVGRPLLYGTTRDFLVHFGLNEITDLPRPREIEEILGETQFETERRMLDAQQAAEEQKVEEEFKSRLPHIPKRRPELDASQVEILARKAPKGIQTISPSESQPAEAVVSEIPAGDVTTSDVPAVGPLVQIGQEEIPSEHTQPIQSQPTSMTPNERSVNAGSDSPSDADRRSRWRTWKDKIQGFIRKLFD